MIFLRSKNYTRVNFIIFTLVIYTKLTSTLGENQKKKNTRDATRHQENEKLREPN